MLHQPLPPVDFMMISNVCSYIQLGILQLCQTSNNSIWMLKIFHQFKICLLWVQGCYITPWTRPQSSILQACGFYAQCSKLLLQNFVQCPGASLLHFFAKGFGWFCQHSSYHPVLEVCLHHTLHSPQVGFLYMILCTHWVW